MRHANFSPSVLVSFYHRHGASFDGRHCGCSAGEDDIWRRRGRHRRWFERAGFQRHPVCRSARRRSALEAAAASGAVGRRPESDRVRRALHAGARLRRHDLSRREQRRLPVSQRVDAGQGRHRPPAGHGLDLRRRLSCRLRVRTAAGRRAAGRQRRGRRGLQLPPGRLRILIPPRADGRIAESRVGQLRAAGPGGRASVGERQHRGLRRRSGQCDDLW